MTSSAATPATPGAASAAAPVLPGAEPWSHAGGGAAGVLTVHGFTGNPASMRGVAEAAAGAGFHVELPRLPGHGTTVEEMLTTGWADWAAEVEAAYACLAARAERIVIVGQSMGGSLALSTALAHPEVFGLVLVNPATAPPAPEVLAMIEEMIADGTAVAPGIGSDIADPDVVDISYDGTPLGPLKSFVDHGLSTICSRYGELTMPLLLITSRQDHVVEPAQSDSLAAAYGGAVERIFLERSYHVATQDYDRQLVFEAAIGFAHRVTAR